MSFSGPTRPSPQSILHWTWAVNGFIFRQLARLQRLADEERREEPPVPARQLLCPGDVLPEAMLTAEIRTDSPSGSLSSTSALIGPSTPVFPFAK